MLTLTESQKASNKELLKIKNLGSTMLNLLNNVGIYSVEDLKKENPRDLFFKISSFREEIQDTKMYDMCTAIIYSAKTGNNDMHWSDWTKIRIKKSKRNAMESIIKNLEGTDEAIPNADEMLKTIREIKFLEV